LGERKNKIVNSVLEEERSTGYICVECKVRKKRFWDFWHKLDPSWQADMTVTKMGGVITNEDPVLSWLLSNILGIFENCGN